MVVMVTIDYLIGKNRFVDHVHSPPSIREGPRVKLNIVASVSALLTETSPVVGEGKEDRERY